MVFLRRSGHYHLAWDPWEAWPFCGARGNVETTGIRFVCFWQFQTDHENRQQVVFYRGPVQNSLCRSSGQSLSYAFYALSQPTQPSTFPVSHKPSFNARRKCEKCDGHPCAQTTCATLIQILREKSFNRCRLHQFVSSPVVL